MCSNKSETQSDRASMEKNIGILEHTAVSGSSPSSQTKIVEDLAVHYGINHKSLMLKIDLHIMPPICMLYLLAFLDKVNLSNAVTYGMKTDLGLVGNDYSIAVVIFFVAYVVFEVGSNVMLKRFRPHIWLPFCMFIFGCITIGQGFVKNYGGLLAVRFLLGMFESGVNPGSFYLLSMWYRREESQKRFSFYYCSTCVAGAFAGLIAYGMNNLDGKRGLESWRYLFIIEGAITAIIALSMYFFMPGFPEEAKYLTDNEKAFMEAKLALDSGESHINEKLTVKSVIEVFKEWKIYFAGLMYFSVVVPAYGYAYFATSILSGLDFNAVQTQAHSIYPWLCAFGLSMISAIVSDYYRHRFLVIVANCLIATIGLIILLATRTNLNARYAGCFLIVAGIYSTLPLTVGWAAMNFSGHKRRAVGTAWLAGFGNIGGIISPFLFLSTQSPYYTIGVGTSLAFTLFTIVVCAIYLVGCHHENKLKTTAEYRDKWNSLSKEQQEKGGDLSPDFVYSF